MEGQKGVPEKCKRCRRVLRRYRPDPEKLANSFDIHIDICTLRGRNKNNPERKSKLKDFQILLSALRNTDGGCVLVHLSGQAEEDRCLSYLDEFLEDSINNFIVDGQLFVDVYCRKWLNEDPTFKDYWDFVVININKTNGVATVDFKTKVCTDFKVERPTTLNIISLLRKTCRPRCLPNSPEIRGVNNLPHESRYVQLKTFKPEKENLHILTSSEKLAKYIWERLRLREYVSCMSKVENGGSFYLGISEEVKIYCNRSDSTGYKSKTIIAGGFTCNVKHTVLKEELLRLIHSQCTVLDGTGCFRDIQPEVVRIEFHEVKENITVLEIAVAYIHGIVFYDRKGPEAYKVHTDGTVVRIPPDEWLERIKQTFSETHME